ncbi:molybdopterin converting factor small subunit [Candidatus Pelagibacter ubique]|jgi:molybdopterin converting factor small subunit|uniref:Molybdopterin converting factor small subunit n=1 Tax=Pelagibacter ubique TaxID=198252 RepID=A0ABX1T3Y9_PELUQ|nr:molybdopterin biosynthesis protein MoeD [Candidatus Pelagibacter ubique]NMN67769.1 molybdopterin converting factor small subunit [Candidatus Pelagibacter ubique]|tara:strand:- start:183 stop:452 length:270 start_codon:yes stop_codon:yes gene_type:complete
MKIKLELFGACRDFSDRDHLEFNIKDQIEIKDFRIEIINYLEKNFKGNESFKKIVKSSAFCSEDNNIINDSYKISRDQKIGIIPPIGGG